MNVLWCAKLRLCDEAHHLSSLDTIIWGFSAQDYEANSSLLGSIEGAVLRQLSMHLHILSYLWWATNVSRCFYGESLMTY